MDSNMHYSDWEKMKKELRKMADKVTGFFLTVDKCAEITQMDSVRIKANALQEMINKLEEAYNIAEMFMEE